MTKDIFTPKDKEKIGKIAKNCIDGAHSQYQGGYLDAYIHGIEQLRNRLLEARK